MTQKQQIQANNAELEKHKQDILSLPMADDVKNGKYVWKKYEYTPAETIQVINPKSTLTYYKSDSFKVSSDDYNVNSVDISFFNGFTLAVAKYNQYIINDGYVTINGGNIEVVYDKTNAILTVKGITYSSSDSGTLNYNGIKTYKKEEKIGGLIGYIVSDLETAHPDSGEQDGYWWERVTEGLPLGLFGSTQYEVIEFTFATNTALPEFKLHYSMPQIPKYLVITGNPASEKDAIKSILGGPRGEKNSSKGNALSVEYWSNDKALTASASTSSYEEGELGMHGSSVTTKYFKAGVEYTAVLMA